MHDGRALGDELDDDPTGQESGRSVQEWLEVILTDFAGTPAAAAGVQLIDFDPGRLTDYVDLLADPGSWVDFSDPTAHRLLLTYGGAISGLDGLTRAEAAAHIASCLQDYVIDETHQPWPQVPIAGHTVVLDIGVDEQGRPIWLHQRTGHRRPLGQLRRSRTR